MAIYDVAVVGLGAMGSAALHHLARRGARVLGVERFEPGHSHGSSHGATRIIRLSYFEHPSYVPLLRRAYELWRETEALSGRSLLNVTGIVEIGLPRGSLVRGTLAAAQMYELPHTELAAPELMRRFPAFRIPADYVGVLQPDGGILAAEPAVAAHLALACAAGAELRTHETVRTIDARPGSVRITTDRGVFDAGAAILAAGPWTTRLLPDLVLPLRVTRQVMAWFEPLHADLFEVRRFPVFMLESRHGTHYGFPLDEIGVKIAKHHHQDKAVDPDACDRMVSAVDEDLIRAVVAEHLPEANGALLSARTCLYTRTPDDDFILDQAGSPNILIASPCSGHGFKFAPVIGEILADLALAGSTRHDISRFRLARFR